MNSTVFCRHVTIHAQELVGSHHWWNRLRWQYFRANNARQIQPPRSLVSYSRDDMKQWKMARKFTRDARVSFISGDVRDKDRLTRALDGIVDIVHAAATKIVLTAGYNPFERVKANINGAMNLIAGCIYRGIKRVVALSTDKASYPISVSRHQTNIRQALCCQQRLRRNACHVFC